MTAPVQDYCRSTTFANILDWRCAAGFTPDLSDHAAIKVPGTIGRGEHVIQPIVDISDGITRHIQNSTLHVVPGSNHFLISTHPQECAAIIDDHMDKYAASVR